ncbi:MAG: energy transducer TonB [Pseudomonadota bacterium]|nr:energy transducer TonB [Pseudomonadota bacterium]
MATDTARVRLELASGRNEVTAPFHETAQRSRKPLEQNAEPVDSATPTQFVVDVPLACAAQLQLDEAPALAREPVASQPTGTARPPWIVVIAALAAVAAGMWWAMSQRMPDIDPRVVITRNLNDAQTAMADGRYTDPPERSAFHYYSAVLALDPTNADALAGIDAIADRHLTNARVLLAGQKIAEAGVALEKVRRVRPEHEGLAALDAQWRDELRKILAASTVIAKPALTEAPAPKAAVAKLRDAMQRSPGADTPRAEERQVAVAPKIEAPADLAVADLSVADPAVTDLAVKDLGTVAAPEPPVALASAADTAANIVADDAAPAAAPASGASSVEPKLVKTVQPDYPQEALMRGLEGWVDVSLQVSPAGDVIAPRVEHSSRGRMFNRAALNAVQQWKYEPRGDGTTSERVRVRLQFKQSN